MITHVYSYFYGDQETERRNAIARESWYHTYRQGGWLSLPVLDETLPRLFQEGKRRLPYIKDLIGEALKTPSDYICITNSDIVFAPSLHDRIVNLSLALKPTLPICGNRKDFDRIDRPLTDDEIRNNSRLYCGIDIFIFSRGWWLSIASDFPDLLLGREAWDAVLWVAMRERGGYSIPNLIGHEKHSSTWEQSANRYKLPGQLYNLQLAAEWLTRHNLDPRKYGIRTVPKNWERELPTTQETPPGGWRVSCGGYYASHPFCFESVYRAIKIHLQTGGMQIPKNLKEIIIRQSHGLLAV